MKTNILVLQRRQISARDIEFIRGVAERHWLEGRKKIAAQVCRFWAWRRRDGSFALERCEQVLVILARLGFIVLPQDVRKIRRRSGQIPEDEFPILDISPLSGFVSDTPSVSLALVRGKEEERLWAALMRKYHPLGDRVVIGEHLKYLAWLYERPVGALLWGRASLKLAARDGLLGWSVSDRRREISRIANNYRFLIVPWVKVKNLASCILGANVRRISSDWEEAFGQTLELLETFVDLERFTATSYLAANWIPVGFTRGHGRIGPSYHFHGHQKLILLYPLSRRFHHSLQRAPPLKIASLSNKLAPGLTSPFEPVESERKAGGVKMALTMEVSSSVEAHMNLEERDLEVFAESSVEYIKRFDDVFDRREQSDHASRYIQGLFSNVDGRHNAERMALYGPVKQAPRTIQAFLTESTWSNEAVRVRHQQLVAESLGEPCGQIIADGSDFAKKGDESAGVERQYCNATGKVDNCQAGVFISYASSKGATIIDGDLYLPKNWYTEEEKKRKWETCRIPEEIPFRTKPAMALEMIRTIHARGQFPVRWVLADEGFGRDSSFLDGIPEDYFYFCEVPSNTRVWMKIPEVEEYTPRRNSHPRLRVKPEEPRPRKVSQLVDHPELLWEKRTLKEGAKGPIEAEVARMRVIEVRKGLPGKEVWLFIRRNLTTAEVKYFLSNAPVEVSMEEMAEVCAARWAIETCFLEAKQEVGMDEYEARSWPGWQHHMTLVMLAHHFLVQMRQNLKKKHPL